MTPLDILSPFISSGELRAQVPHIYVEIGRKEVADFQETDYGQMIEQGLLAWKVAKPKQGLHVIYTPEPRNPATNRVVKAYLWMTPLAVQQYGDALHDIHVKAHIDREAKWTGSGNALSKDAFLRELLLDTVAASPQFQDQVLPETLTLMTPIKKPAKAKTEVGKIGADGFVKAIGARSPFFARRDQQGDILALMDELKIGPNTRVGTYDADFSPNLFALKAIAQAGSAGFDWLIAKGFAPQFDWYTAALTFSRDNTLEIWDRLAKVGVDPNQTGSHGSLWHAVVGSSYPLTPKQIAACSDWLRAHGVNWTITNPGGEMPLTPLLFRISRELGLQDFWGGGKRAAIGIGAFFNATMADLSGELKQLDQEVQVLEDLAFEMVKSGVSLTKPNKSGEAPIESIHPEQSSAQKYLDTTGENLFTCDHQKLRRTPAAYGAKHLAFIRRLEKASGLTLLDDPAMVPKSTRRRMP